MDAKPNVADAGDFRFRDKLIYGAVICTVLLGVAAYKNVGLVEKYAPSLNSKLHSGDIREDTDAEYAWDKLFSSHCGNQEQRLGG